MLIKNTPDYEKYFKNEYLFIIGINNEFKYFLDNMNEATRELFENFRHVICAIHDFQKQCQFGCLRRCVCCYFIHNNV